MADTKLTALTDITTLGNDDYFYVVDDPAGTPVSRRVTALVLKTYAAPAASDTVAGVIEYAIQSEQETGTSTVLAVTPGRQHFHPSASKCWVRYNSAGTVAASYNTTSVTDTAAGNWTVNIATDFSTANYCGVVNGGFDSDTLAGTAMSCFGLDVASAAGTFNIGMFRITDASAIARADPSVDEVHVSFFGDHT